MANRYWVGGTANWDGTAGTKWALTSGGAGGEAVPTSADDVFFDANSGTVTVTIATTGPQALNLNFTGFTGTLAGVAGQTIDLYGSLTLGSGMTRTTTAPINLRNTTTATITSNGITWAGNWTFQATAGNYTFNDNFVSSGRLISLSGIGTINGNGNNITFSTIGFGNNAGNVFNLGGGTWTLTGNDTISGSTTWGGGASTVINSSTSTIKFTDATANAKTFSGQGKTYNNVWFSGAGTGDFIIAGSNTFNDFKVDTPPHTIKFTAATTQHVTTFTVSGTAGNEMTINSTTTATHALVKDGGGTISSDYLNIQHSVATPASTWYAGTNSTDNQAVATEGSGWIFTAPPVITTDGNMFLVM